MNFKNNKTWKKLCWKFVGKLKKLEETLKKISNKIWMNFPVKNGIKNILSRTKFAIGNINWKNPAESEG